MKNCPQFYKHKFNDQNNKTKRKFYENENQSKITKGKVCFLEFSFLFVNLFLYFFLNTIKKKREIYAGWKRGRRR